MAQGTKPAIASKSIWGNLLGYIGIVTEVVTTVANSGVVPPHTGLVLMLIGNLLSTVGRLDPEIKPISGAFSSPEK